MPRAIAATLLMVSSEPHRPIHDRRNDVPAGLVGIIAPSDVLRFYADQIVPKPPEAG